MPYSPKTKARARAARSLKPAGDDTSLEEAARDAVRELLDALGKAKFYPPEFLAPEQAAMLLCVELRTLEKWRHTGEGPPFAKFGVLVRYPLGELRAWSEKRTRTQTGERAA